MALNASSLITAVGGATSNSYNSLQELADFRDLNVIDADGYDAAEPDEKVRAAVKATRRLDQEIWQGSRASASQRLAFPRYGVPKADGVDFALGAYGGLGYGLADVYLPTEIPPPIKEAHCLLALAYLDGFADGDADAIESWQADDVRVSYRQTRPDGELPA